MKKIFALAMLVATRLATAQSFTDVDDSTYNPVHLSVDEPVHLSVDENEFRSTAQESTKSTDKKRLLQTINCSGAYAYLSLSNFDGQSKEYNANLVTRTFGFYSINHSASCGTFHYSLAYSPSSSTSSLIYLSSLSSTVFVNFGQSANRNDVDKYMVTIKAFAYCCNCYANSGYSYSSSCYRQLDSATATYSFLNTPQCSVATFIMVPHGSFTTSVGVAAQAPTGATYYDSVSASTANNYCGPLTLVRDTVASTSPPAQNVLPYLYYDNVQTNSVLTIQAPVWDPDDTGTYVMHFKVCIMLYPTVCGTFQSTFTVTKCALTSPPLIVNRYTDAALVDQTYDMTSATTLLMEFWLKQITPLCKITGGFDWTVTAGPVILGSHPGTFLTVDAATGVYTVAPGLNPDHWGTYTIVISSVKLYDVTYDGSSPATTLATPSQFILYAHKGCKGSAVSGSIGSISLNAEDPINYYPAAGFTAFTDTKSTAMGDPLYCPKSYTVTISPANTLTTFEFDETTRRFQIFADQPAQVRTYTVTLKAFLAQFPTESFRTVTFYIYVNNPSCVNTVLEMPASPPVLTAINTSLFVSQTRSPTYGTFPDTVNSKYPINCRNRYYKIRTVVDSASAPLSGTELSIVPSTGTITVLTSDVAKIGTHTAIVSVYLYYYPGVTLDLSPFTITIASCLVTAVQVLANVNSGLYTQYYTLSSTATLEYQLTTRQTPACGNPATDWAVIATGGLAPSHFQTITNGGLYQVGPVSSGINIAGTYTISISEVNLDGQIFTSAQLSGTKSFSLLVTDPCTSTSVYTSLQGDVYVAVWDTTFQVPIVAFTDSASNSDGNPNFCAKTYSVSRISGQILQSYGIDASGTQMQFYSDDLGQIGGPYVYGLTGSITNYPSRKTTFNLNVYITDPCLDAVLSANGLADMQTSVLVQNSDGTPFYQTRTVTGVTDSISFARNVPQICGSYSFSISSSVSMATTVLSSNELAINGVTGLIRLWTQSNAVIGTHTALVEMHLTSYPTIAPLQLTFAIEILPCILEEFTMINLVKRTYVVADPETKWDLAGNLITQQVPACNYAFQLHENRQEPLTFLSVTAGDTLSYAVYTRDLADAGTSQISVTATLSDYIPPVGQLMPESTQSFEFEVVNPCLTTSISYGPSGVESLAAFPGYSVKSLQKYNFNDTASFDRTQVNDEKDFCDEKLLAFALNGKETALLTGQNGDYILLSVPSDVTEPRVYTAKVTATMKEYPDISSNPILFRVTVLLPEVPKIPTLEFTVGEAIVQFAYDRFVVRPVDFDIGENSIEAYVFTGKTLPKTLDMTSTDLTKATEYQWIHVDYVLNKVAIFATNGALAGQYTVVLVQSFKDFPDVNPYSKFKVIINPPLSTNSVKKQPPYFKPPIETIVVQQCPDSPKKEIWTFTLPEIVDPQKSKVATIVLVDSTVFLYDNPTSTISQIKFSESPANHTIQIILVNEFKLKTVVKMQVQFQCDKKPEFTFIFTFKELQERLAKQPYKPTATIGKIDQSGLLRIQFAQKMKIPEHPEYLKTQSIEIDAQTYPIIALKVLPGKFSELSLLNFNWTLVEFQPTQLLIQLDFENQNYVSSHNSDRDQIEVTIYGFQMFADSLGNLFTPPTVLTAKYLPTMTSATKLASAQSAADTTQNALNSVLFANTFVMILVAGPLQQLLSSVKQLQIIVHIILINVAFPAVTSIYMGMFMSVLTFQFHDFGPWYDYFLSLDPDSVGNSPYNNQFNLMGYNALYIIKNFGTLCLTILIGPALYYSFQVLTRLSRKRFEALKIYWEKMMRFNYWIALINETYMFLAVCCGLNLFFYCSWSTYGDSINSLLAIFFSACLLCFPFFVAIWYNKPENYQKILKLNKDFFARYGNVIEGLNFKRQDRLVLIYATVCILRKIWLAHIVVFQQEYAVMSILQINFQALIMMIISGYTEPIKEVLGGRMNLINEAFVLALTYHLYQFTDFMTDLTARDWVGQSMVYFTFFNVGLNIAVVGVVSLFDLYRKGKLKWLALKQEKAIAKRLLQRQKDLQTENAIIQPPQRNFHSQVEIFRRTTIETPLKSCLKNSRNSLSSQPLSRPFQIEDGRFLRFDCQEANPELSTPQQVVQDILPGQIAAKVKPKSPLRKLKDKFTRSSQAPSQAENKIQKITSLNDVLRKNPTSEVQVIASFRSLKAGDLIEVKEVGCAGQLLHIALTINNKEAFYQTITKFDNPSLMKKKRNELLLLAEFTSLDKPDHIWQDIKKGYFDKYLKDYQRKKLHLEFSNELDSTFLDVGDYGPEQKLEYRIMLYETLRRHDKKIRKAQKN